MLELSLPASLCIRGGGMLIATVSRKNNTRQDSSRQQYQDPDSSVQNCGMAAKDGRSSVVKADGQCGPGQQL